MSKLTITEALQEIKTIGKRLDKKRKSVVPYLIRDSRARDPLAKDGGSEAFVKSERQSIHDLEERVIAIRTAIQRSNLDSQLQLGEQKRSVAEWLTWRREISGNQVSFLKEITNGLTRVRDETTKKGGKFIAAQAVAVNDSYTPDGPPEFVVNVDERALLSETDSLEQMLGDLDGKLSLFNATTVIDV